MCGTDDLGLVHTATEVRVKGSKEHKSEAHMWARNFFIHMIPQPSWPHF